MMIVCNKINEIENTYGINISIVTIYKIKDMYRLPLYMHESLNLLMSIIKLGWKQCVTNRNIVGSVDCCDKESVTNKNVCILYMYLGLL